MILDAEHVVIDVLLIDLQFQCMGHKMGLSWTQNPAKIMATSTNILNTFVWNFSSPGHKSSNLDISNSFTLYHIPTSCVCWLEHARCRAAIWPSWLYPLKRWQMEGRTNKNQTTSRFTIILILLIHQCMLPCISEKAKPSCFQRFQKASSGSFKHVPL